MKAGAFVGSAGEGRISSATSADLGEAAIVVLTGEDHDGKVYELAGDDAYTLADLAAGISRQTGKAIPYKNLPRDEYAAVLGPVEIHREFMTAAARWMMALKLWSVLSARIAMRLNSLSLQKKFSIR